MKKVDDTQLWKITDKDGRSFNQTQWGWGVTNTAEVNQESVILCSPSAIHAYVDPMLGVFLNPIHGNYQPETMLMWESEGWIKENDGSKVGCRELTTWRTIDFEIPNLVQKRAFAILAVLELRGGWKGIKEWTRWAEGWLSGKDRSEYSRQNAYASASASASAYAVAYASAYAYASASAYAAAPAYAAASAYAAAPAYAAASAAAKLDGPKIACQAMSIT